MSDRFVTKANRYMDRLIRRMFFVFCIGLISTCLINWNDGIPRPKHKPMVSTCYADELGIATAAIPARALGLQ